MDGALGVPGRKAAIIHRTARVVLDLTKIGGKFLRGRDVDFENYRLVLLNSKRLSSFPARIRPHHGDKTQRPDCFSHRSSLEVLNRDETMEPEYPGTNRHS